MAALSALLFDILSGSLSGHLSPKAFHPKDVCASLLSCPEGKFCEGQNHIVVALSILMLRPQFAFKKHLMKGQKKKWSQLKEGTQRITCEHLFCFLNQLHPSYPPFDESWPAVNGFIRRTVSRGQSQRKPCLTSFETWGKFLSLPVPQWPHLQNANHLGLLKCWNKLLFMKSLE